jgi:bacterioferritin (cytochrome b1)
MKGDPQIIEALNRGLTVELTAINQYFIQAKMNKNWGFDKLAKKHYVESLGEMNLKGFKKPMAAHNIMSWRGKPAEDKSAALEKKKKKP